MTTVQITTPAGAADGEVELPAEIFDVTANVPLMHQVVVAQLAAARQGTHKTKTRGEVSGGGKKPYRQKGTGRARQGSTRAPQFNGGGVVHGPTVHGYAQRTPKKMKAAALRGALSDRARGGNVHVLSTLAIDGTPSTKTAMGALKAVSSAKNILVVLSAEDVSGWKSLRNVPEVHLITSGQLNTYDVLISDDVVFTRAALDEFVANASRGISVKVAVAVDAMTRPSGRHAAADVTTRRGHHPDQGCHAVAAATMHRGGREVIPDPRDIIVRPIVSEKSYGLLESGSYTFEVHPDANKTQVKIAIEKIFDGVKVISVNTLNRQGKRKRTRAGYGQRKATKRAIVTLSKDSKPIDVFSGA